MTVSDLRTPAHYLAFKSQQKTCTPNVATFGPHRPFWPPETSFAARCLYPTRRDEAGRGGTRRDAVGGQFYDDSNKTRPP